MRVNKAGWALAAMAAMGMVEGCAKKVGGQVVAVVNGQEVTQGELNSELGGQQIPPGADRNRIMAQLLQQVVTRKLLVGRAKEQGLDKAPAYLAQVQRGQDQVLITMLASNAAKTVATPDTAAADQFMAENASLFAGRKRYTLDQIVFPAKPDPVLAAKLKDAKTMPQVEAALTSSGIAFQRGTARLDTAQLAPAIGAKIAALPPGEPFLVPQAGQMVVNVIRSVESMPVPADQARPAAAELLRRQTVERAMRKQADDARASATISYAPGFAPLKAGAAPAP